MATIAIQPEHLDVKPSGKCVVRYKQQPLGHGFAAMLYPEEEGGFSIVALHTPGVVSQGESKDEAISNIREAFHALSEACRNHGEPIPFSAEPLAELTPKCRSVWVSLNV